MESRKIFRKYPDAVCLAHVASVPNKSKGMPYIKTKPNKKFNTFI